MGTGGSVGLWVCGTVGLWVCGTVDCGSVVGGGGLWDCGTWDCYPLDLGRDGKGLPPMDEGR